VSLINVPILLTLIRLVFAPLLLPFFLVFLLPLQDMWINSGLVIFFVGLSLTDFFDGYLARKYNQVTVIGSILDPLADKFLLISTLISLLAIHRIFFFWVIIFLVREFFVTGLRLMISGIGNRLSVSYLAKIKTLSQMFFLSWAIFNPFHEVGIYGSLWWNGIEYILLAIALVLSLLSAIFYAQDAVKIFKESIK